MISSELQNNIEHITGERITGVRSLTGGCISNAMEVILSNGKKYFLKTNSDKSDMFHKEANGLIEIKKSDSIRVPEVILTGNNFILLEMIETAPPKKDFFADFGKKFAMLHKTNAEYYGFYEDNYIGSTVQLNIPEEKQKSSWADFYFQKRILYQYKLAEKNGYGTIDLMNCILNIEDKIYQILAGSKEPPSLLHGDLWSGNYIVDETGTVCLIDPATYYGHREADLAMTKMFGSFHPIFYNAYEEIFPLSAGYRERENIYKLYHALNHLNLFGKHYYNQTLSLAKYYI